VSLNDTLRVIVSLNVIILVVCVAGKHDVVYCIQVYFIFV